jgi:hypothetical protein
VTATTHFRDQLARTITYRTGLPLVPFSDYFVIPRRPDCSDSCPRPASVSQRSEFDRDAALSCSANGLAATLSCAILLRSSPGSPSL